MAPHIAAAAPHQAQAAPILQQQVSASILDRESNGGVDEQEQQAWRAYLDVLPSVAQLRLCTECAHFAMRDMACRKIITTIDPVFGPRLAKCRDARKSDGPCGFAAKLFAHPSNNLPADVTNLGNGLGNAI
ncbi:hypothetical protein [Janthinobacterium sp. 75]|uniref:hypothetical protein n=1 Tax=Janthinobacterium sp. 75 TaxID=2135628 RepID=UPI001063C73D|nr:hypothetical protein [Janthinobacterium sp. 75]TDY35105.1 hypothetical protein C8C89_2952 [Janthinobacterium sp. 75]